MADTLVTKGVEISTANTDIAVTDTLGSAEVLTVLSIFMCNKHATLDTTFDLRIDVSGGTDGFVYFNQPLPALSTFIHSGKIVLIEGDVLTFQSSEAGECSIVISALKQTSVTTSSGSEYLTRSIHHLTGSGQVNTTSGTGVKVILGFTVCSKEASNDTTFTYSGRQMIYRYQPLPASSTFENSDKLIMPTSDQAAYSTGDASRTVDVITSYLRQVP